MVLTLMIPLRKFFSYQQIITMDVLEKCGENDCIYRFDRRLCYGTEYFIAWYSHNIVEMESFRWRAMGEYRYGFYIMVGCNTLIPLLFFV